MKIRFFLCLLLAVSVAFGQKKPVKKENDKKEKKDSISSYDKIVKDAVLKKGLFTLIEKDDNLYFEIPDSLMGKDMLIVNKISSVGSELNDAGINRGMNYQNILLRFYKGKKNKKVWVKSFDPKIQVDTADAISKSVAVNYNESIFESFKIEAFNKDSTAVVVKVNKVFDGSSTSFNDLLNNLGLGGSVNKDLSFISETKSFPQNVVIKSVLSSKVTEGKSKVNITIDVTSNLVLLPEKPMKERFYDDRVGFFNEPKWYYTDMQQQVDKRKIITRWRLEPKDNEINDYLKGKLVEPKKKIVYYIDPSTPPQWVPYIMQGILDWNVAFEAAGFKNAVEAKLLNEENKDDFDIDDVRYSVLSYAASDKANAMGPSVVDPRSGEIIEADVIWWHNVMTLLSDWMRVQTGIIDPQVRKLPFPEQVMGNAIRFVSSHEIGHTFGLMHNMGSSFAYPVDSLRSPSFTSKMGGTAPSIMDYARFNYVAQEGDGVKQITLEIGIYDKYAIAWGYRWTPTENPFEDKKINETWIAKHAGDPLYFYGAQQPSNEIIDPRSQSEDLGNNAMKASSYGLINLKKTMPHILDWNLNKQENYTEAGKFYMTIINQWQAYNFHVLSNVGGIYITPSVYGDGQKTFTPVPYEIQQEALEYLVKNAITIPTWLFNDEQILQKVKPIRSTPMGYQQESTYSLAREKQYSVIYYLFENGRLLRLLDNEFNQPNYKGMTVKKMFEYLRGEVFPMRAKLDIYQRMTQKNYVDALIVDNKNLFDKTNKYKINSIYAPLHMGCEHLDMPENQINLNYKSMVRVSEVASYKRGELLAVLQRIKRIKTFDTETRNHYNDLIIRIKEALNLK
ncbi:zinc-dependent metalloprotease [Ornithobacterium rhinotracheale]|uniref:zinc-dependent metalloprotease n=1 Tax=Ornithobacterium rhinotracheale TaxID=28251 RepID=UPI001FF45767|nr:zinc-dependent metalloprotease [Ornithobacterium rhinotracheale]MCK0201239.1 zinc-dependent metalloprotease [Ornithobacterium rhinotracheale]